MFEKKRKSLFEVSDFFGVEDGESVSHLIHVPINVVLNPKYCLLHFIIIIIIIYILNQKNFILKKAIYIKKI